MTYVKSLARNQSCDKPVLVLYGMYGNDVCNRYTYPKLSHVINLDYGFINPSVVSSEMLLVPFPSLYGSCKGMTCLHMEFLLHYIVKRLRVAYQNLHKRTRTFMLSLLLALVCIGSVTSEKWYVECKKF
jgi:hypothetical protein